MLEHVILYLQHTISFLIELVQESIPNKLQSAGRLLAAVGVHIPNRPIILALSCDVANFPATPPFLLTPSAVFHHTRCLPPQASPGRLPFSSASCRRAVLGKTVWGLVEVELACACFPKRQNNLRGLKMFLGLALFIYFYWFIGRRGGSSRLWEFPACSW